MLTTLGVIHRMEDIQVVCFALVFGIMAAQSRRDRVFRWLLVSYLLGSAVSVVDVSATPPMPQPVAFLNLALISVRYFCMAMALAAFGKTQTWFPRAAGLFCTLPVASIFFSIQGAPSPHLLLLVYGSLAAQFLVLALALISRREKSTRTPRQVLAAQFFISAAIRCCQVLAVLRPTTGIVWLRDQLWFFNSALVGCMVPFTIIWMMNARVHSDLRKQSLLDPLTGLLNRRGLQQAVVREMARYGRSRQDFAVALADIDHFKTLNDSHGHACGDHVLQQFAEICQRTLRQTDVIARSGGEEFTILLPIISNSEMEAVLERVRLGLANATLMNGTGDSIRSTVSIGVTSTAGRSSVTWDMLLHEADAALYNAKRSGRNCTRNSAIAPQDQESAAIAGLDSLPVA